MHMSYYNYHATIKHLLKTDHCIGASIFKEYHHISPALVFYFDNHHPMPVRKYKWSEYLPIITDLKIPLNNVNNLALN